MTAIEATEGLGVPADELTPKQLLAFNDAQAAQDAYLAWAAQGPALLKARKAAFTRLTKTGVTGYRMAKLFKVSQTTIGNILGTAGTRSPRRGARA